MHPEIEVAEQIDDFGVFSALFEYARCVPSQCHQLQFIACYDANTMKIQASQNECILN